MNRARVRNSSRVCVPQYPIPARSPPTSWYRNGVSGPLYGTRPSTPSGTSLPFPAAASFPWLYRSPDPAIMAPSEPIPRYALKVRPLYRIVCPGLSASPANSPPIMTEWAPAASALVMSPE